MQPANIPVRLLAGFFCNEYKQSIHPGIPCSMPGWEKVFFQLRKFHSPVREKYFPSWEK